jgi:hypothetical protein
MEKGERGEGRERSDNADMKAQFCVPEGSSELQSWSVYLLIC